MLLVQSIQDILTGKTIGCGTRRGKLYYLDWAPDSEVKVGQAFTTSGTHSEGERETKFGYGINFLGMPRRLS
ncbi:unnamed protein product [Prunus armeniaca]